MKRLIQIDFREPSNRDFLAACLREGGYQVAVATNGAEALGWSHTADAPVDVLITDLFLTDLHGLDVATRLRDRWPDLQVVFLSDGHGPVAESLDDVPLVTKPFTARALATAMTRLTATRRAA